MVLENRWLTRTSSRRIQNQETKICLYLGRGEILCEIKRKRGENGGHGSDKNVWTHTKRHYRLLYHPSIPPPTITLLPDTFATSVLFLKLASGVVGNGVTLAVNMGVVVAMGVVIPE